MSFARFASMARAGNRKLERKAHLDVCGGKFFSLCRAKTQSVSLERRPPPRLSGVVRGHRQFDTSEDEGR